MEKGIAHISGVLITVFCNSDDNRRLSFLKCVKKKIKDNILLVKRINQIQ